MTVRRVEIRLVSTGEPEVSRSLDKLDLGIKDLLANVDKLKLKLDQLGLKRATPSVEVKGLAEALAGVTLLQERLDHLNGTNARATSSASTRGSGSVTRLDDAIRRSVNQSLRTDISSESALKAGERSIERSQRLLLDVGRHLDLGGTGNRSLFSRLRSGLGGVSDPFKIFSALLGIGGGGAKAVEGVGGAAGGGGGGLGSTLAGGATPLRGALIGGLVAWLSSMAPALIPFGIGGAVGLGAGGGAFAIGSAEHQKILQLQQQLASAKGPQAKAIQAQIAAIQQRFAPELGLYGTVGTVGHSALDVFNQALTSKSIGFSGGPGGHPGTSFLQGIDVILKQVGSFVKSIGPMLGQMFRASLPFISAFAKIMEQLAKAIMPAFTQTMKEFQPFIPLMVQGFKYLAMGLATFLKNLGPGMKDAAIIFKASMAFVGDALGFLGKLFSELAIGIVRFVELAKTRMHQYRDAWDESRHEVAVIFDGMRHDIAHVWDMIWNNTVGRIQRGWSDVRNLDNTARRGIYTLFDGIRHDVAALWDRLWSTLISNAEKDARVIINDVKGLATGIWNALRHLPGILWKAGKAMIQELWNGMKSIGTGFLHWVSGIGHDILNFIKNPLKILSPSRAMFDVGRNVMLGLEHGMKSRITAVRGLSGHIGGSVQSWIQTAMRAAHAPASWLPALERLVSLESGGNPRAVNPTAIAGGQHATGLWQMLPSTYASYAWGLPRGDLFNPVVEGIAALRYIMSNYGSPFNIPGLMSGHYQGYASGGWINEPVLGVGTRSGSYYGIGENGPEYVSPQGHGGGSGNTYIFALDESYSDEQALRLIKKVRRYKQRHGHATLGIA